MKNAFILAFLILATSCSTIDIGSSGPVNNEIDYTGFAVVGTPSDYLDPNKKIEEVEQKLAQYKTALSSPISLNNKYQERYYSYAEALDSLKEERESVEDELTSTGELTLTPGRSYHFSLESFCVFGKTPRPVKGDGFKLAPMIGAAKEYLPLMLHDYSTKNVSQEDMQGIVWSLISGLKFDELSDKNKTILKKFYPDAEVRFGNRMLQNIANDVLKNYVPDKLNSALEKLSDVKEQVRNYQNNVEKLESLMAPIVKRSPIPIGWTKTKEGYFVKVTGEGGFSKVDVEIYVPNDLESTRSPQSEIKLTFSPWKYVALPGNGQRLAMSSKVIRARNKIAEISCKKIKNWKPTSCHELSEVDRKKIIEKSDPINFPNARYVSPPKAGSQIEDEADCSHFTHEIYRRVGIEFPYLSTSAMKCLNNLKMVVQSEARVGDLVLFKNHIGILDKNGELISATKGGKTKRSTLKRNDPNFIPSITRYKINTFGEPVFLRWSCK